MSAFFSAMARFRPLWSLGSPVRALVGRAALAACPIALALAAAPSAQEATTTGKPDHVLWRNSKDQVRSFSGQVTQNGLDKVVLELPDGRTRDFETGAVEGIELGDVPLPYADGVGYGDRGDWENAAANFRLAATAPEATDVVRASARLRAVEALMNLGARDPAAFGEAKAECERFLSDHPTNREVPLARLLLGRAQRLSGETPRAAETYRELFQAAVSDPPQQGYPRRISYEAGLAAAEAFLAERDTLQAREIYSTLEAAVPRALARAGNDDNMQSFLRSVESSAKLGEGFCQLASGSAPQAKTFFQGQADAAGVGTPALRSGARFGLAEALFQEGDYRGAQLAFAQVSAIDHTDRDRVARALVGFARCALRRSDQDGRADAQRRLTVVQEQYGDTPAVLAAQELAKGL
jgi:TolA-binding protein